MPPALMNFLRLERSIEFTLFRGVWVTIRSIIAFRLSLWAHHDTKR